jgi:XTP/dITP diphosphohydrolase
MLKIVLASRNKHKIREIKEILSAAAGYELEILSLDDIGVTGDIEENGNSFEENAKIKASLPASMGYIGIADDSGLSVDALNGEPGIYSARYAGEPCNDQNNNDKLLMNMQNVTDRTARFVSCVAAVRPDGQSLICRGECPGTILHAPQGNGGFGYDPLFWYEPLQKTFAELTSEEKNTISHRARALEQFCKQFIAFWEDSQ